MNLTKATDISEVAHFIRLASSLAIRLAKLEIDVSALKGDKSRLLGQVIVNVSNPTTE